MKKQNNSRKYNFADSELYMLCKEKVKYVMQDLDAFQSYNYSIDKLQKWISSCEKFKSIPDDDEMVGTQMILTQEKSEASEQLRAAIRTIMTRVAIKYTNRSGQYRKYGTNRLGDMSDAHLLFCSRRVARVAKDDLNSLVEVGISTPHINKVLELSTSFERLINEQQDIVAERDMNVEKKVSLGNEIYEELVLVCKIGRDIWTDKDEAKVAFYTIYNEKLKNKRSFDNAASIF